MTTILDALTALLTFLAANPVASTAALGAIATARPVYKAFIRALERRIDQMWSEHESAGEDDDQDIAVIRVRDKVKAGSVMSMLPNGVIEARVRSVKQSTPPPSEDKPPAN